MEHYDLSVFARMRGEGIEIMWNMCETCEMGGKCVGRHANTMPLYSNLIDTRGGRGRSPQPSAVSTDCIGICGRASEAKTKHDLLRVWRQRQRALLEWCFC